MRSLVWFAMVATTLIVSESGLVSAAPPITVQLGAPQALEPVAREQPSEIRSRRPTAPRSGSVAHPNSKYTHLLRPKPFASSTSIHTERTLDRPLRRARADDEDQGEPEGPVSVPALPEAAIPPPAELSRPLATPVEGGEPLSLQSALYGAITHNPDVVALRNSNIASPEAVEVARRFPTTLNPTLWIDYRPITLIPRDPFGGNGQTGGPYYHHGQQYLYISLRQPVELGRQTRYRHEIAQAALNQQQWTVVQAEMLSLVQTYRFFQTAAYRREKLRVARQLAEFNDRLLTSLRKRLEANQVAPADVVLAEVENEATRQLVDVARQDYANALADLRNQIGMPETAGTAEPLGEFVLPRNIPEVDEEGLVSMALQTRPEIFVARAQAAGALSAVKLAKGDRIPTPVVGPEYQIDEAGLQYFGMVLISPIPVINNGKPLVRQREAEYCRALAVVQQMEKRTAIQVKAAAAKWNAALRLVNQTAGLTGSTRNQVDRMERLFDANQANLTNLLQSRQRLIQLENAELDALWQATQAQADLLTALGAPSLISALHVSQARAIPTPVPTSESAPATMPAAPPMPTAARPR